MQTKTTVLFVALVAFIAYQTVNAQDEPRITMEIWPEIKRVGMTGYLNCTVTRQSNNKVQWIDNKRGRVLTSDDRIEFDDIINEIVDGYEKYGVDKQMVGDLTTYMLIIRRLALTDAGTYTCQINVKASHIHPSKDGMLVVLTPPTIVQGETTQTVTVDEFENVNLTCAATGYPMPNISWVRVNGNVLPPPYNRYAVVGKTLTLYNAEYNHGGMYRCVADNNVRPLATYDTNVLVFSRPRARAVQSSYGQAQNRLFDITFECVVSGYPAPELRWYHILQGQTGLEPVIDDDKHFIHQLLSHGQVLSMVEIWYQMTIINVQANDYGIYVCEGTNRLGTDRIEITIYETSECQGANCPPEGGQVSTASHVCVTSLVVMTTAAVGFLASL